MAAKGEAPETAEASAANADSELGPEDERAAGASRLSQGGAEGAKAEAHSAGGTAPGLQAAARPGNSQQSSDRVQRILKEWPDDDVWCEKLDPETQPQASPTRHSG